MDELVQWLDEQIDADERVHKSLDDWHARDCESIPVEGFNGPFPCDCGVPGRTLREIEAKREALAHYERIRQHTRQGDEAYVLAEGAVSRQIQIMATVYADRPGYREEWRP